MRSVFGNLSCWRTVLSGLVILCTCSGCAVVTVAGAAVSVATTAVGVGVAVVGTTVDVGVAGVKAVVGSDEQE